MHLRRVETDAHIAQRNPKNLGRSGRFNLNEELRQMTAELELQNKNFFRGVTPPPKRQNSQERIQNFDAKRTNKKSHIKPLGRNVRRSVSKNSKKSTLKKQ